MENVDYSSAEELLAIPGFDPAQTQAFFMTPHPSWAVPLDPSIGASSAPVSISSASASPLDSASPSFPVSTTELLEWPLLTTAEAQPALSTAAPLHHQHYPSTRTFIDTSFGGIFPQPIHQSPVEMLPHSQPLPMDNNPYALPTAVDPQWQNWHDFTMMNSNMAVFDNMAALSQSSVPEHSPASTYIELRSCGSSTGDPGWTLVDTQHFHDVNGAIFNPSETLHNRTSSSNSSDTHYSWTMSDFEEQPRPMRSPESESQFDYGVSPASMAMSVADVAPIVSRSYSSQASSPTSVGPVRKSPSTKNTKPAINKKRADPNKKDSEKKVGRRRGPLLPEQRKQASEIRKLRACLRCKFLKKTCDKGEICTGCQPSHARLWQVPCTRIDIKDIGYFMKDFKADYERHATLGFSVANIKGFSTDERTLFVTHGYGFVLPISAREVFVHDEDCFQTDWLEDVHDGQLSPFAISTGALAAGMEGIPTTLLNEYLDRHIDQDGAYEAWIDKFFDGTPFLTELLKTTHRYYTREKTPSIRKALKFVLAYNLTQHVTLLEGINAEDDEYGRIDDERSSFYGKTFAPVMINFQIKAALGSIWRDLQKEVLEDLSALYSGVYNGDKLKNWPIIFLLAAILLGVWEEMQFDCHYRVPDTGYATKFCSDMETTPVGVIVGLFAAISQKLPAFSEWDTKKHHELLHSNPAVCDYMTEMRQHVTKYDTYLRSRSETKFDAKEFDCLSNKFLSKLVIRA